MPKLPWFPYFPSDWARDTRCLSLAARGAWIDILGVLWNSKTRGKKTLSLEGWAGELGKSMEIVEPVLMELKQFAVALITRRNGRISIMSRRQVREENAREHTRLRVMKYREIKSNASCNGAVTVQKSEVRIRSQNQKSELELKKEKKEKNAQSRRLSDEDFLTVVKTSAAYAHVNIDSECSKMDIWILAHPGRQKTRKFMLNWLNKIEHPVAPTQSLEARLAQWVQKEAG